MLHAPLGQRPRRLALEVDDNEIVAAHQHLPEVVVAVVAGLEARTRGHGTGLDPVEQALLLIEQRTRVRLRRRRHWARCCSNSSRWRVHHRARAASRRRIARFQRLGIESRVTRAQSQRFVQFRSARAQGVHQ